MWIVSFVTNCVCRLATLKRESTLFASESCSVILRVYSPCAWFVEGRSNPIGRRVSMTRNRTLPPHNLGREPFLRYARASTQRWRRRRSKRRDSRFVCAVRASRWWEAVLREVVPQALLFEKCRSRETVLRKTILCVPTGKLFLEKSFCKKMFCEPLRRRRYSYSLHTYWEPITQTGSEWGPTIIIID